MNVIRRDGSNILWCHECNEDTESVVEFGDVWSKQGSRRVCSYCLALALDMIHDRAPDVEVVEK